MSTATEYPHLSLDASGKARVGQTRYTVQHLATEHHQYGWSAEELLRQHPDLRPEEVYAALTYFYDHFSEMTAAMTPVQRPVSQSVTREELLQRRDEATA